MSSHNTHRDAESISSTQHELEYSNWWSRDRIFFYLRTAHIIPAWNYFICFCVLFALVLVIMEFASTPIFKAIDLGCNIVYGIHVASIVYSIAIHLDSYNISFMEIVRLVIDFISFLHYAMSVEMAKKLKFACYYLRFNRPMKYLWSLNDYQLQGSVVGTTAKYCYLFFVLRITFAYCWLLYFKKESQEQAAVKFLNSLYIVHTMFISVGPSEVPATDTKRIFFMVVNVTGCLVVTGVAVASLSLVISIYLEREEAFRQRYRLIMKDMKASKVPPTLSEKVQTFYKMYWNKQKAVSTTRLLPTFPPTLLNMIYTDIYFEATQKNRVLRELSYEFLSKVAMKMETVLYIPGDTIIKRNSKKSNMIFIAYGDIEMLTAEDDSTAILRMTRGTALSGCAGGVPAACARAYVNIRAATFCITHVVNIRDLWLLVLKHVHYQNQSSVILSSFYEHLMKVKSHYLLKLHEDAKFKSSIYHFKRKLIELKEVTNERGNSIMGSGDVLLEVAGSYIMRKPADASQTNESDAICLRPTFPCILQPSSSLLTVWNFFVSCLIILVCFTHPYYLVFMKDVPVGFRFFDYVVTVLYALDLLVYLSTGENVEAGVPITFSQTSSQQMRSSWFALDVAGTLPIFEFIGDAHFAGINKLFRLPKAFRMLKTMDDIWAYHSSVVRYVYYTLVLLIACYFLAALQQGFLCFQFRHCLVSNFTHSPFWEDKPLDVETVDNRLFFGLYWAISMITFTAHKQAWVVNSWDSTLYTIFVLEVCIVLRIFIEAAYSADIMVTTALREDYDACIANVKNFLMRNSVDPQLRKRFINYLKLCWYADKAFIMTNIKSSIFYDLPPHVYRDIVLRQRSKYLLTIPFIKLLSQEDLKAVSSQVKLFYTSPNEVLLNTGDISNEMYVIKQGMCEIINPETKQVIGTLGVKDHFGAVECLLRLPAYYTVRAVTHLQVFSISNKVLAKAMDMPKIKDAIGFAKERPEYSRLLKAHESFQPYIKPAPVPNTERFRRRRKFEMDSAYLEPFYRLGSMYILRYIFPRFTIRPDGAYLMRYEWARGACALMSALVFPPYIYLEMQWPALYAVALLLDFTAYFDILQRMFVGYFNEVGALVYHPVSTAAHYLKGAFIVDLFGCLPLEILDSSDWLSWDIDPKVSIVIKSHVKQWLMLNRLLQLYRLPSAMQGLQRFIERRDILLVIKAVPLFMVMMNTMASLMVFYSVWVHVTGGRWSLTPFEDTGGSWLQLFNSTFRFNMTETPWNLHLAIFFWVVYETTTTGYSCFNPSNIELMVILILGMIISATILTYFAVRIISARANVNKEVAAYQEHLKDINAFMRRESLPKNLQKEVAEYYECHWDKTGGIDCTNVLKLCDQITLRTDAILHIYGPTFEKCPFLAECDVSLLRIIGRAVRSVYFLKGMLLIDTDDVIKDLYFIADGVVAVKERADSINTIATLSKGSVFGNLENASTVLYKSAIVAQSMVHVLRLNAETFHRIISDFPLVVKNIKELRSEDENFITGTATDDDSSVKGEMSSVLLFRCYRKHTHFFHEGKLFQMYLVVVSLICMYADVYNAGFQYNTIPFIIFLYFLDICFYLKIFLYCGFPYLMKTSSSKKSIKDIRQAYFKNEFKHDLISCLPIELIFLGFGNHKWMIFSWLRLNRMFRIVTVYKYLVRSQERITSSLIISTAFTVLIWFTLFTHVVSCLWLFIGMLEESNEPKSSWIYKDSGESWCQNLYICSLYFVLTTFMQTGVGDIMPKNQSEVMFVSILQIVSTMLCMIYVGYFSNLLQFRSFRSFRYYCKFLELQEFMKNNRVSQNLVAIVNNYSFHLWRESRGRQVPYFLQAAPQSLRLRVMSAAYMEHLTKNPVFENCDPAFLRQLVGCLQLFTYDEGLYVVKASDITDSMYMVHTGRVSEISAQRRLYTVFQCFGVKQGLFHDLPYTHSYITETKSQVLTLKLNDWEDLLKHFPESKSKIYKYFNKDNDDNFPQSNSDESDNKDDHNVTPNLAKYSKKPDKLQRINSIKEKTLTTISSRLRRNEEDRNNMLARNNNIEDHASIERDNMQIPPINLLNSSIQTQSNNLNESYEMTRLNASQNTILGTAEDEAKATITGIIDTFVKSHTPADATVTSSHSKENLAIEYLPEIDQGKQQSTITTDEISNNNINAIVRYKENTGYPDPDKQTSQELHKISLNNLKSQSMAILRICDSGNDSNEPQLATSEDQVVRNIQDHSKKQEKKEEFN